MDVKITIQGAEKLESLLKQLPMEGPKIVRAAASKSLKKMSAAMRSAIPAAVTEGHNTKTIAKSIFDRVRSKSEVIVMAKSGVGVGMVREDKKETTKSKLKKTSARHAHLYVAGTVDRYYITKRGKRKFVGRMDPRKYMPRQMSEVISSNTAAVGQVFVDEVTKRVMEKVNGV